ncbi:MAG: hypothetical protein D3907_08315, partial [Candidatus Electrothrix sp. AUS3]|nr:hypothetical protein [Candidatus Electrothrix gigas]
FGRAEPLCTDYPHEISAAWIDGIFPASLHSMFWAGRQFYSASEPVKLRPVETEKEVQREKGEKTKGQHWHWFRIITPISSYFLLIIK